ncbi:MAG: 3-methyl-2-oxobutanoate dehydrogenase subunit VorB [Armatimonadota bacterium]|nr:3-methyl-2-oxobutanoate dehydrogenase subunit VorB [Armatimonadota bacterium]
MTTKVLMKGNEAVVRGAIAAGCRAFFGYPITPQNEVPEYMSKYMPEAGGVFVQAESEVAAINMVYGAACAGVRAMTSSSSPGISLKMEGISYLAGAQLPCLIVNVQRGGPGLGNIAPSQSDYFQAVKGGGHGDYKMYTFAPWSVKEMFEHPSLAFEVADKYRGPAMILTDAIIGQMLEPIEIPEKIELNLPPKPWATTGAKGRGRNSITSLYIVPEDLERINLEIQANYKLATEREVRFQEFWIDDANLVLVAYGCVARISRTTMTMAREKGLKVGLFRPITLFPFPSKQLLELAKSGKHFLVVEMSAGQMVEDVRLSVNGEAEVDFYGRLGGIVPSPNEILEEVEKLLKPSLYQVMASAKTSTN